jgi:hypothetical protein
MFLFPRAVVVPGGVRDQASPRRPSRLLKNVYYVILNEVKDLNLVEKNRFFAALRMTNRDFCSFSTPS